MDILTLSGVGLAGLVGILPELAVDAVHTHVEDSEQVGIDCTAEEKSTGRDRVAVLLDRVAVLLDRAVVLLDRAAVLLW